MSVGVLYVFWCWDAFVLYRELMAFNSLYLLIGIWLWLIMIVATTVGLLFYVCHLVLTKCLFAFSIYINWVSPHKQTQSFLNVGQSVCCICTFCFLISLYWTHSKFTSSDTSYSVIYICCVGYGVIRAGSFGGTVPIKLLIYFVYYTRSVLFK